MCDEAVSALDVSVQSQIVNPLLNLQREMNLAIIFIAHDLSSVVNNIRDRGLRRCIWAGSSSWPEAQALYLAPRHPYTQAPISAIPVPDPAAAQPAHPADGDALSPIRRRVAAIFTSAAPMQRIQAGRTRLCPP